MVNKTELFNVIESLGLKKQLNIKTSAGVECYIYLDEFDSQYYILNTPTDSGEENFSWVGDLINALEEWSIYPESYSIQPRDNSLICPMGL